MAKEDKADKYLTAQEAQQHMDSLSLNDIKRLRLAARRFMGNRALGCTGDDMISALFIKVLEGERRIPRAVPFLKAFGFAVKSEISNLSASAEAQMLRSYDPATFDGSSQEESALNPEILAQMQDNRSPEMEIMYRQAIDNLETLFPDAIDRELYEARVLSEEKPHDIRTQMGMSQTEYDGRMKKSIALSTAEEGAKHDNQGEWVNPKLAR